MIETEKASEMKNFLGIAAAASIVLTGCNTVAGVGKDVTAVGKGVTHVAFEVRDEVFGKPGPKPQGYASVGEACDPSGDELSGGNGLPACPRRTTDSGRVVVTRSQ